MRSKSILFDHWRRLLFIAFPLLAAIILAMSLTLPSLAAKVINETSPISITLINPCNGELIPANGTEHLVITLTNDNNGGFHTVNQVHIALTGTGEQTGTKYRENQDVSFAKDVKPGEEETFAASTEIISLGTAPSFLQHILFHTTINPDGTVTASVSNESAECK